MKEYLFRNKLTVKEFAFRLKISASHLYQLISGDRKPSLKLAQKIEQQKMRIDNIFLAFQMTMYYVSK